MRIAPNAKCERVLRSAAGSISYGFVVDFVIQLVVQQMHKLEMCGTGMRTGERHRRLAGVCVPPASKVDRLPPQDADLPRNGA